MWRDLTERERKRWMCASTNCDDMAVAYFEAGGVGSYYCGTCKDRINGVLHRGPAVMFLPCGGREVTHAETIVRVAAKQTSK